MSNPETILPPPAPLKGSLRLLARLVWWMNLGMVVFLLIYLVPRAKGQMRFDPIFAYSFPLVQEIFSFHGYLRYFIFLRFSVAVIYIALAAVIYIRKPDDRMAVLTSLGLISLSFLGLISGFMGSSSESYIKVVVFSNAWLTVIGFISLPILLLVFPDGRIQPRFIVPFVRILIGILIAEILLLLLNAGSFDDDFFWTISILPYLGLFLMGFLAQFYRFFRISILFSASKPSGCFLA